MKEIEDERKIKNNKLKWQFVFLEVCFIFIFGILVFYGSITHTKKYIWLLTNGIKTNATITRIDKISLTADSSGTTDYIYTTYVTYQVNNNEYTTKLSEYNSSMMEGIDIYIYYNPDNPYEIVPNNKISVIAYSVCGIIGIVNIVIGVILIKITIFGRRKKKVKEDEIKYEQAKLIGVDKTSKLIKEKVDGWTYEFEINEKTYLYVTENWNEIYEVEKIYKVQLVNGQIKKVYNVIIK